MLPRRTITKRQKKEEKKKRWGVLLLILGLITICFSLFFAAFLQKPEPIINPLSKDQASDTSKLIKILKEKNIMYSDISTDKDLSYIIKLPDKRVVVIDSKKDIEKQLSSLQFITSQLKIEGKTFKRLDFRYQRPVITF